MGICNTTGSSAHCASRSTCAGTLTVLFLSSFRVSGTFLSHPSLQRARQAYGRCGNCRHHRRSLLGHTSFGSERSWVSRRPLLVSDVDSWRRAAERRGLRARRKLWAPTLSLPRKDLGLRYLENVSMITVAASVAVRLVRSSLFPFQSLKIRKAIPLSLRPVGRSIHEMDQHVLHIVG